MSQGAVTWVDKVNEDGSFAILARVVALDGTGTTVCAREGPCITQADVSTITCKVFSLGTDKNNTSGTEITPAPSVVVADTIYDSLQTVGWGADGYGYNFRADLSPAYVPTGDCWYLVEVLITLTSLGKVRLKVKVKAMPVQTS